MKSEMFNIIILLSITSKSSCSNKDEPEEFDLTTLTNSNMGPKKQWELGRDVPPSPGGSQPPNTLRKGCFLTIERLSSKGYYLVLPPALND